MGTIAEGFRYYGATFCINLHTAGVYDALDMIHIQQSHSAFPLALPGGCHTSSKATITASLQRNSRAPLKFTPSTTWHCYGAVTEGRETVALPPHSTPCCWFQDSAVGRWERKALMADG